MASLCRCNIFPALLCADVLVNNALTFTFRKWGTGLWVFEADSMRHRVKREAASALHCVWHLSALVWARSSACWSFTSFLYSISWFPVHVEAAVWERFAAAVLILSVFCLSSQGLCFESICKKKKNRPTTQAHTSQAAVCVLNRCITLSLF